MSGPRGLSCQKGHTAGQPWSKTQCVCNLGHFITLAEAIVHVQARQKARTAGLPFFDHNVLSGRFPSSLPDSLKRVPGHLNQQQQRVYEDFARIPRAAASAQAAVGGAKDASMDAKVWQPLWGPARLTRCLADLRWLLLAEPRMSPGPISGWP